MFTVLRAALLLRQALLLDIGWDYDNWPPILTERRKLSPETRGYVIDLVAEEAMRAAEAAPNCALRLPSAYGKITPKRRLHLPFHTKKVKMWQLNGCYWLGKDGLLYLGHGLTANLGRPESWSEVDLRRVSDARLSSLLDDLTKIVTSPQIAATA